MVEWVVICEARADHDHVTQLADRVALQELDWAQGILDELRQWSGLDGSMASFTSWKEVKGLAQRAGLTVHGRFGPGHAGGAQAEVLKALKLVARQRRQAKGLLLSRDTDGHADRSAGMRAALEAHRGRLVVCLAMAHPEREAWVIQGFEPTTPEEEQVLQRMRVELGHDPRSQAHLLNPKARHTRDGEVVKRSTKRILDELIGGDATRASACWCETPLEVLRERGLETGLTEFLHDLVTFYVPCLGR